MSLLLGTGKIELDISALFRVKRSGVDIGEQS